MIIGYIFSLSAQEGISINSDDGSAVLDLSSTSKGFLAPQMTEAKKMRYHHQCIAY